VAKRLEALLGDRIPLEDHIADDVVLTKGNGVLAMFSADGVFPDTADEVDIVAWFDRLHNALRNIAAEDVELTVYSAAAKPNLRAVERGYIERPSRGSWKPPITRACSAVFYTRTGCF
jgi:type IV secretory pathway VirB4 component